MRLYRRHRYVKFIGDLFVQTAHTKRPSTTFCCGVRVAIRWRMAASSPLLASSDKIEIGDIDFAGQNLTQRIDNGHASGSWE
jgi:hypothetical protein